MKKILTLGSVGAVCVLIAYTLWTTETSHTPEDDHHHHDEEFLHFSDDLAKAHGVDIQKAGPGPLRQRVRAPAQITLASDNVAHVIPKVSGIAVKAYKNLGETVREGDILALLDSKEMAEAKAAYLTALKKQQLASSAFDREHSLYEKQLSSAEEFHNAENKKDESQIDLELAKQKLHALGLSFKKINAVPEEASKSMKAYVLRSPISGQVIARHITPGELLTTDAEVYVVADLSTVWAEVNVFSHDRQHVKVGQPVTIRDNHGNIAETEVAFLSPIVDQDTRTSSAIVKINNSEGTWLPGTFVQAEFITDVTDVPLAVSKEAIQNIDGVDIIFVAQDDGFAVRPVTVGRSDETYCEILSGLNVDDTYATKNTFLLKADLKKEEAEHMD
ncbi:MAG: efflux RND transporter periplasmic adaptor subunit [Parachlamydiaceae bacterium]